MTPFLFFAQQKTREAPFSQFIKMTCISSGASVVQWLVRWTLGRRARVQVLPGACRCILKQDALPTLLRLSDKT